MNRYQKAAALAVIQAMFTGCGGGSSGTGTPAPPPPAPAPAPAVGSPSITTQPVGASVITGDTATFTVVSTGTTPTYQWMKNGTAISGATSDSYTTPAATYADEGAAYTVVVTNSAGSATS